MPFTISHAAAALPFRRTRLVMSAVVFGCVAPDLEYFLWLRPHGHLGHTLPGLALFDLPAALIALLLFQRYARQPLVACLPARLRERVRNDQAFPAQSAAGWLWVCISILVGSATHIVWDLFTHTNSWLASRWSPLRVNYEMPLVGERSLAGILQYISSALGLIVILLWFVRWYRRTPPSHSEAKMRILSSERVAISCALILAVLAGLARGAADGLPNGVHGAQRFMTAAAVTGMTTFCIAVLAYGFVHSRMQRVRDGG